MRFWALLALALPVFAGVTPGRRASPDVEALRSLLALGRLENAVFDQGLNRFNQVDFVNAGLPPFTRGRFAQILKHVEIHIAFLRQAITDSGSPVVQPCSYTLYVLIICAYMRSYYSVRPSEDPQSLIQISVDIETILASAYNGAMGLVEDKNYRVILASILGTISRQAGWMNSAVLKENPWNTAFDVPLTLRQAWTAVQRYISNCPPENATLFPNGSLDPFTQLNIVGPLIPGSTGLLTFDEMESSDGPLYVVFMTGIGEIRTRLRPDGSFDVPQDVADRGAVYIMVISNEAPITDENTIAGPALAGFNSNSFDASY